MFTVNINQAEKCPKIVLTFAASQTVSKSILVLEQLDLCN